MIKKFFLIGLSAFLFFNVSILSQEIEENDVDQNIVYLPEGLSISNQVKYSYDIQKKIEIFEDWFNADYRSGIFSAGIRFETFQPNDPSFAVNRSKKRFSDIAFKYLKTEIGNATEGLDVTVGNYYAMFGRGMILKIFEDRNLRVDNNLLGVKFVGRYADFVLTALTGMPENTQQKRTDIIHAADLEYRGINDFKMGLSFASNQSERDGDSRTRFISFRIQPSIWNFDLYSEYGIKQNDDIKSQVFKDEKAIIGKAFYSNLNFYYESLSLVGEYKYYDNYEFATSNDLTTVYNMPPAVRKDYTYLLLNRHPSPLNANNEQGFGVEASYNFYEESNITLTYGETKTLPSSSYYQQLMGSAVVERVQLREFFTQVLHHWGEKFVTIAAFGYNEELSNDTKNLTPVLDLRYYYDDINTFHVVVEHQLSKNRTTNEKYYDDVLTLEYLRSPKFSLSFLSEMQTREPIKGKIVRTFWNFLQVGYKFGEHTDVSLLFGSRQAGAICIGGVCRYEPEFRGVELKMLTRL